MNNNSSPFEGNLAFLCVSNINAAVAAIPTWIERKSPEQVALTNADT